MTYSYYGRTAKCDPIERPGDAKREAQALRNPLTNVRLNSGHFLPKQPDDAFLGAYAATVAGAHAGEGLPDQALLADRELAKGWVASCRANVATGRLRAFLRLIDGILAHRERERAKVAPMPWLLRQAEQSRSIDASFRAAFNVAPKRQPVQADGPYCNLEG